MPTNKVLQLILNGAGGSTDGWTLGAGTSLVGGEFQWTGVGGATEDILQQDVIGLVDGNVYKVYIDVTNSSIQDADGFVDVKLGGGNPYKFRVNTTFNSAAPLYLKCGSSPEDGLEIIATDATAGDTMTFDDISVIVTQFTPSTDLDSVHISGDTRVPLTGTDGIENGDFSGGSTGWFEGSGWSISGGVANATNTSDILVNTGSSFTVGKEYFFNLDNTLSLGSYEVTFGGATFSGAPQAGTMVASAVSAFIITGSSFTGTIDNVMAYEATPGPSDEYVANGTLNGQTKYTSAVAHADGSGGSETWDLWWDGIDSWIISLEAGTLGDGYWKRTDASPVGPYFSNGAVFGAPSGDYGPTDHSTATGSPGMETDGTAGYIDLKTPPDYINDLKANKLAVISVFNVDPTSVTDDRIFSNGTSGENALYSLKFTNPGDVVIGWELTISLQGSDITEGSIHNMTFVSNAGTIATMNVDGELKATDSTVGLLNDGDATLLRLSSAAASVTGLLKGKFGFTAILDLSDVTTVDAAFSTGLSDAINTAALANDYDATAIADAIVAYMLAYDDTWVILGSPGVYWPLDEAGSGDTSDYYLLAKTFDSNAERTSDFYGLVSASGVTGASLVASDNTNNNDQYGNLRNDQYGQSVNPSSAAVKGGETVDNNDQYGNGRNDIYGSGLNNIYGS